MSAAPVAAPVNPLAKEYKLRGGCARVVRFGFASLEALQSTSPETSVAGLDEAAARRKLTATILGYPGAETAAKVAALSETELRDAYKEMNIAVLGKEKTKELLNNILNLPKLLPDVVVTTENKDDLEEFLPEGVKAGLLSLSRGAIIRDRCFKYIADHPELHCLGVMKGKKTAAAIDRSKQLSKLPTASLKAVCRERGCRSSGKKDEILARLAIFGGEFNRGNMSERVAGLLPQNTADLLDAKTTVVKKLAAAIGVMSDRPITKTYKKAVVDLFDHPLWPTMPAPPADDILKAMADADVNDLAKLLLFPKAWNTAEYRVGLVELRDGKTVTGGGAKERLKSKRAPKDTATTA